MALPNFIDVVTLTVGKQVTSAYRGGATPLVPAKVTKRVSLDAVAPDANYEVVGQASIGVQRSTKQPLGGQSFRGDTALMIVGSDNTVFSFNAAATGTTQINPEEQGQEVYVPQEPQFSTSIFWV